MLVTLKLRNKKYSNQIEYLKFFNVKDSIVISLRNRSIIF